jgi:hypothetical protein
MPDESELTPADWERRAHNMLVQMLSPLVRRIEALEQHSARTVDINEFFTKPAEHLDYAQYFKPYPKGITAPAEPASGVQDAYNEAYERGYDQAIRDIQAKLGCREDASSFTSLPRTNPDRQG